MGVFEKCLLSFLFVCLIIVFTINIKYKTKKKEELFAARSASRFSQDPTSLLPRYIFEFTFTVCFCFKSASNYPARFSGVVVVFLFCFSKPGQTSGKRGRERKG